jgi:protein SCO1
MAKWLIGLVAAGLVLSMAALLVVRFLRPPATAERLAHQKPTGQPLFAAPPFSFVDQHGETASVESFRGRVWVANFIFTSCRTICPLLTAKMVQLQRQLGGVDVQFVSFSVDPTHDTPDVLAAYAKTWAPTEGRWRLLATTEAALPGLAKGFHVTAEPSPAGSLDPILHSSVFVLVDQQGLVRGVYDSEHGETFRQLGQAIRVLANSPGVQSAVETDGETLYHSLSCASCHENRALAPSLFGLAGQRRDLDNGLLATFDAAHVKESIVAPEVKRTRGYPLKMPSYEGLVDERQLEALTAFILTKPSVGAAQEGEASVEIDPVCHMKVRPTPDGLHVSYDGGVIWFCSGYCQRQFEATPSAYLP